MIYVTWLEKGQEEPNRAQFEDYDAAMLFCKVKGLDPKESITVMCW